MTKRAVIYARVSTNEQAEKGTSLESQIVECRRYAEANNLDVIAEITDEHSGNKLYRPGLDDLREMIAHKTIDAVIVIESSRWTRNLHHRGMLRKELYQAGVELHYTTRGKVGENPQDRLIDNVDGAFVEHWRDLIIFYTRQGRNDRAAKGKPVLMGQPPYGYKKIGKGKEAYLIIDENETRIVRNIFSWYVNGKAPEKPMSLQKIADELNRQTIPPPRYKGRIAQTWYPETIRKFLRNETYIGKMYYGKVRVYDEKRVSQPRDKWIEIDVPELKVIDEDLFFAAGNRTIINAKRAKRNRKYSYLLAGHIRCGICGYSGYGFTDSRSKKKNQYYRCSSAVKAHRTCPTQSRGIPTKRVDNAVWEWLVKLLTDETSLNEGLKELSRKQENEVTVKKKDLQNLEGLIDETESRISRLVREITNHEPGIILDTLRDEIKKYGKQKESQLKEYQAISSDVQSKCDYKEVEKQIHEMVKEVKHKLPNATFEVKRSLLDVLNVQVTFHREIEEVWFEAECSISPQKEGLIASSTS